MTSSRRPHRRHNRSGDQFRRLGVVQRQFRGRHLRLVWHDCFIRLHRRLFPVSVAAPVYLKKTGELTPGATIIGGLGAALMVSRSPAASIPCPPSPTTSFPYFFAVYLLLGVMWFYHLEGTRSAGAAWHRARSRSQHLARRVIGPPLTPQAGGFPPLPRLGRGVFCAVCRSDLRGLLRAYPDVF